jgi:hypothetical protein
MAKEATMNTNTLTINDKAEIISQFKVCQGNLQLLNDFAPNHPLVLKNTKWMLDLIKVLESFQSQK